MAFQRENLEVSLQKFEVSSSPTLPSAAEDHQPDKIRNQGNARGESRLEFPSSMLQEPDFSVTCQYMPGEFRDEYASLNINRSLPGSPASSTSWLG